MCLLAILHLYKKNPHLSTVQHNGLFPSYVFSLVIYENYQHYQGCVCDQLIEVGRGSGECKGPIHSPDYGKELSCRQDRLQSRLYSPLRDYEFGYLVIVLHLLMCDRLKAGSLKMNTALEYSTRVVQEGGRRYKKSTLNDLVHLTPLRIPLMNPPLE
jgi:hypothetical protein